MTTPEQEPPPAELLVKDIWDHIFVHLEEKELGNFCSTSKWCYSLAANDKWWPRRRYVETGLQTDAAEKQLITSSR